MMKHAPGATAAHDRILAATTRLLRAGVQAATIERIIAEAGVARMTPYRHFGGKDELVSAALEAWGAQRIQTLSALTVRGTDDPGTGLAELVALIDQEVADGRPGSLVLNAAVELRGDPDHPAHAVIEAHRRAVRALLEDLAKLAGADDPAGLAAQVELVLLGALATAVVGGPEPGAVRVVAAAVLKAQGPGGGGPGGAGVAP
jgi:AcrR family transcriptional regulator